MTEEIMKEADFGSVLKYLQNRERISFRYLIGIGRYPMLKYWDPTCPVSRLTRT